MCGCGCASVGLGGWSAKEGRKEGRKKERLGGTELCVEKRVWTLFIILLACSEC